MSGLKKRATIYFDPEIHKAIKIKSAILNKSISEVVDEVLRNEFIEDLDDISIYKERISEPTISYEKALMELRKNGQI